MPLDTTLLKPAQIGTSEIATKNDITTSLGAYNPAAVINTNTTTIDGGKITTGTITADAIDAYAISGKIITGGEINGTIINGAYINGSVVKSSWIDLTSTNTLTNWQYYTPATIPSAYAANFARNNDGSLVTDGSGYIRLVGQSSFLTPIYSSLYSSASNGTYSLPAYTVPAYSYDSYTISTVNRSITASPTFLFESSYSAHFIEMSCNCRINSTVVISVSFQLFDTTFEYYASIAIGSSTTSGSGNGWLKKNGSTIWSKNVGSYAAQYTGSHVIKGDFGINIQCNVEENPYGEAINYFFCDFTSQSSTITSFTSGDIIKIISGSIYQSGNPGTRVANIKIPIIRIIS